MPRRIDDLTREQIIKAIWACIILAVFLPPSIWLIPKIVNESSVACSIEDFYVSFLQNNNNTTAQSVIYFDLKLQNHAPNMGAYYDNLNLTFSYVDESSRSIIGIIPIANCTVPGFHQGIDKETHRKHFVLAASGTPWREGTSKAVFRVDLETAVRFKLIFWMGKRYTLLAEADVEIDGITGRKLSNEDILLKNMNNHHTSGWLIFGIIMLVICRVFAGGIVLLIAYIAYTCCA